MCSNLRYYFFYIPRSSKVALVPVGPIGIGNLPDQMHLLALRSTGTPFRPLARQHPYYASEALFEKKLMSDGDSLSKEHEGASPMSYERR